MKARYIKYILHFKQPAGTSRGILTTKETYFLILEENGKTGYGECNLFKGLSSDDVTDYEEKLNWLVQHINLKPEEILFELRDYPSIIFGWETALQSLKSEQPHLLYPSGFTEGKTGIPINGLIWMGSKEFMFSQIKEKLKVGFKVIKLKIGAINFQDELDLLKYIRSQFSPEDIEIRVDANGAFAPEEAMEKLKRLSEFDLHSIEQPVKAGQLEILAQLCEQTPLPIALDEELIGYNHLFDKQKFLSYIGPQYIIIKPALHGGFTGTKGWIEAAENIQAGWWITSALESNVGLNAIAQYTYQLGVTVPQGLGTGGLFTNNFSSPLYIENGELWYKPEKTLEFNVEE